MLRITVSESAEAAEKYLCVALKTSDYYAKESVGRWSGTAATRLGLKGEVTNEDFVALARNLKPETKERLTQRTNTTRLVPEVDAEGNPAIDPQTGEPKMKEVSNRRAGYDLTFSIPKSVSLYLALTDDPEAKRMVMESLFETMKEVERRMETKVRKGYVNENRVTGNLVYAYFVHTETRPVQGIPDAHVHIHCFVHNATWDEEEKEWKALEMRNIVADSPFFDALFDALLADKLIGAGFGIRRTENHWELASVSRELVEKFSRRTKLIEEIARVEHTKLDADARALVKRTGMAYEDAFAVVKGRLGGRHREKKDDAKFKTREELVEHWKSQMTPEELASLTKAAVKAAPCEGLMDVETARTESIRHLYDQVSMKRELHVSAALLRRGIGRVSVEKAVEWPNTDTRFYKPQEDGKLVTTHAVYGDECAMVELCLSERGKHAPLGKGAAWTILDARVADNPEQAAVVRHLLECADMVMDIHGPAGSGKTEVAVESVKAIEALSGRKVFTFAPSNSAVEELRKRRFQAETLHQFATSQPLQEEIAGQVIWMDEASFLSVRQMRWLVDFAYKHNCRLVLGGDVLQHHSVQRGDALRLLEKCGAVAPATLTEIFRQQVPALRDAIFSLSQDQVEAGFDRLDEYGVVREEEDASKRLEAIVALRLEAEQAGKTSLIVAPTHAECRRIAEAVRSKWREAGLIRGDDVAMTRLQRVNVTEGQLRDSITYRPGDVVEFHRKTKGGFKSGEKWTVARREIDGTVIVQKGAVERPLPLTKAKRFGLYRTEQIRIAEGDVVRMTKTVRSGKARFINNELMRVKSIEADRITFEDGRALEMGMLHLDQGHAVTSHASQGKGVDWVIASCPVASFSQVNRAQFYVTMSRGRSKMIMFTDSKAALREAVLRPSKRVSPYEFRPEGDEQTEEQKPRKAVIHLFEPEIHQRTEATKESQAHAQEI